MNSIQRITAITFAALLTACATTEPANTNAVQSDSELEAYCQDNPDCRRNARVTLKTPEGRFDTVLPTYWPAVGEFGVSILPGEELFVEARIDGKMIGDLKQVPEIVNPENTFTFRFKQEDGIGMLLSVKNPFDETVKYSIDMIDFEGRPHETSSCPLVPNGGAYESWPHPIPEIHITNFRILQAGDGFVCKY